MSASKTNPVKADPRDHKLRFGPLHPRSLRLLNAARCSGTAPVSSTRTNCYPVRDGIEVMNPLEATAQLAAMVNFQELIGERDLAELLKTLSV